MSKYWFLLLTLIPIWFIIIRVRRKKVFIDKITYRQSNIHDIIKNFLPPQVINSSKSVNSQARKHHAENMIRVVMIEGKAYWVSNNVFYVSEIINGDPDIETAKPIDTENMSKQDLEKMLHILDSLGRGTTNDRGSAGNT